MKKTNSKRAKKINKVARRRTKKYPVHYLAVILALALVLEGVLFGITTGPDWRDAIQIIDVSSGVTEVSNNLSTTFQPIADVFSDVNQFYQLSATEMTEVLDLSNSNIGSELELVYNGVSEFYQQASSQMASVLDISSVKSWSGQVAGVSISR